MNAPQWQRWTVAIPDGRREPAVDVYVPNLHHNEMLMRTLLERGGCDAVMEYGDPPVAPDPGVRAKIRKGVVHCGSCGSSAFQYEESVPSVRSMDSNEGRCLTFWGSGREYDGDDDPGVVCANCDTTTDLPSGVEINWR